MTTEATKPYNLTYDLPLPARYRTVTIDQTTVRYDRGGTRVWTEARSLSRIMTTNGPAYGFVIGWNSPIHGFRPLTTREQLVPIFVGQERNGGEYSAQEMAQIMLTALERYDIPLPCPNGFESLTVSPIVLS